MTCLATHHSNARTLSLENKPFNFIIGTFCRVSVLSMEIPSLCRTWFLPPSNTMWTVSAHSECTVRCTQVIGGGPYRCTIGYCFGFHTDEQNQELLESWQSGAMIILLIVSTDKTQLTVFNGKMAYPVYMTIGNIPKEICQKLSRCAHVKFLELKVRRAWVVWWWTCPWV